MLVFTQLPPENSVERHGLTGSSRSSRAAVNPPPLVLARCVKVGLDTSTNGGKEPKPKVMRTPILIPPRFPRLRLHLLLTRRVEGGRVPRALICGSKWVLLISNSLNRSFISVRPPIRRVRQCVVALALHASPLVLRETDPGT